MVLSTARAPIDMERGQNDLSLIENAVSFDRGGIYIRQPEFRSLENGQFAQQIAISFGSAFVNYPNVNARVNKFSSRAGATCWVSLVGISRDEFVVDIISSDKFASNIVIGWSAWMSADEFAELDSITPVVARRMRVVGFSSFGDIVDEMTTERWLDLGGAPEDYADVIQSARTMSQLRESALTNGEKGTSADNPLVLLHEARGMPAGFYWYSPDGDPPFVIYVRNGYGLIRSSGFPRIKGTTVRSRADSFMVSPTDFGFIPRGNSERMIGKMSEIVIRSSVDNATMSSRMIMSAIKNALLGKPLAVRGDINTGWTCERAGKRVTCGERWESPDGEFPDGHVIRTKNHIRWDDSAQYFDPDSSTNGGLTMWVTDKKFKKQKPRNPNPNPRKWRRS